MAVTVTAEDPLKRTGVSQYNRGPLSLFDHATTGAPGFRTSWLESLRISLEVWAERFLVDS